MKTIDDKNFNAINVLLIILTILCVIFLLFAPRIKKIHFYNSEIISTANIVNNIEDIEKNPSAFAKVKDQAVNRLNMISEKISMHPMIPQVMEQISKTAKELGVSVLEISPMDPVENQPKEGDTGTAYYETPIQLSIKATYKDFGRYLDVLGHLPRLIKIDEFSIKSNSTMVSKLDIKLKISVFHYGKD